MDHICGSWTIRARLPQCPSRWIFLDSRHDDVSDAEVAADGCLAFPGLCREWNGIFRSMRTDDYKRDPQMEASHSDERGHRHMSAGLHAILYACELGHREIKLYGFDNVDSGGFTWSITRGPDWNRYPDHRWDIEREMVAVIATRYGANIESHHDITEPV